MLSLLLRWVDRLARLAVAQEKGFVEHMLV